jgi:hypothetical protein
MLTALAVGGGEELEATFSAVVKVLGVGDGGVSYS